MKQVLIYSIIIFFFSCSLSSENQSDEQSNVWFQLSEQNYSYIETQHAIYPKKHEFIYSVASNLHEHSKETLSQLAQNNQDKLSQFKQYILNQVLPAIEQKHFNEYDPQGNNNRQILFNHIKQILENKQQIDSESKEKILITEYILTNYLRQSLYIDDIKFNVFSANVINRSPAIIKLGETYKAEISLSANDSNSAVPLVLFSKYGNDLSWNQKMMKKEHSDLSEENKAVFNSLSEVTHDTLKVEYGLIYKYEACPTQKGVYTIAGELLLRHPQNGDTLSYPFESSYEVR